MVYSAFTFLEDNVRRNWKSDAESLGYSLIEKLGDILVIEKDNFTFNVHRSNWPPTRLSPVQCTNPTEYFKHQVRFLHGDKYDLTPTVFKGADENVDAICSLHGKFSIPAKHLKSKRGCPTCGYKSISEKNRLTIFEFINSANLVHNFKYDYSETVYTTAKSLVKIKCPIHGLFEIQPSNHLCGKGCMLCGRESASFQRRLSNDEVIERFKNVHRGLYDYDNVVYDGDAHELLDIICREHGLFKQSYANHNNGQGCHVCAREFSPRLKRGFVKSGETKNYASIYLIRCYDQSEEFYKIGITTKDIKVRFSGQSSLPYDYDLLDLFISSPSSIWDIEKVMHRIYKEVKYIPLKQFGGMYECFSYVDASEYKKLLNCVA